MLMTDFGVGSVKFQDSIATEPRFAFRRWYEAWVEGVNLGNREVWLPALVESLRVTDLETDELDYNGFIRYLTTPPKQLRLPNSTVVLEDNLYIVRGTLEVFTSGDMIFEGMIELVVHDVGMRNFKIFDFTCYPHFRISGI